MDRFEYLGREVNWEYLDFEFAPVPDDPCASYRVTLYTVDGSWSGVKRTSETPDMDFDDGEPISAELLAELRALIPEGDCQ